MKKATTIMMKVKGDSNEGERGDFASHRVDARSNELNDWRADTLARIGKVIRQAAPDLVEEVKWKKPSNPAGVAVWSHPKAGMICTGEMYQGSVKMTFARGAALADPAGLFNASLEGKTRRAIDFHEGDKVDEKALIALIRAAVALDKSAATGAQGNRSG